MHKYIKRVLFSIIGACLLMTCNFKKVRKLHFPKTNLAESPLIPMPLKIDAAFGGFPLDEFTGIQTSGNDDFERLGTFLVEKIKLKTRLALKVNQQENDQIKSFIGINLVDELFSENLEAYELVIGKDSITINANTADGAFRAIQTLRQLVPEMSNDTLAVNRIWVIPTGTIFDAPQYEYRATMLDVARHFFNVEELKKYIDVLSYYKINFLHLHLSDDQGWRIEIKSWPKLTTIGGSTEVGGEAGGFYTQEDYAEIVAFAAQHYMTIIPEIDMPGHTNAASVAYPLLNGNGKTPKLYTGMRVGFSTFDTRKDSVYTFLDDVIREISMLTPGPYFHIGGDESHVTKKKDYLYFVDRVEKIVQQYGKQMIGWDEVANAEIDSTSIVQYWSSRANANRAIKKGMKIIISPAHRTYLDMKYDSLSSYGLDWAGNIRTDSAYMWSPEEYGPKESILGIEAPLWSETISELAELHYLAFPRVIGYAELGWSIQENRVWENYKLRLAQQVPFLKRMEVNYYPSPLITWQTAK
ncbi:MAG: hexosaminidase [Cyclobacteriaceae bacterium]|jgi:hexosaminidase